MEEEIFIEEELEDGFLGQINSNDGMRIGTFNKNNILIRGKKETNDAIIFRNIEEVSENVFQGHIRFEEKNPYQVDDNILNITESEGTFILVDNEDSLIQIKGKTNDKVTQIFEYNLYKIDDGFAGEIRGRLSNIKLSLFEKLKVCYGKEIYFNGFYDNDINFKEGIKTYFLGGNYIEEHGSFDKNEEVYNGSIKVFNKDGSKLKYIRQVKNGKKINRMNNLEITEQDRVITTKSFNSVFNKEKFVEGRDFTR